jgi:prevent-host-death family protein
VVSVTQVGVGVIIVFTVTSCPRLTFLLFLLAIVLDSLDGTLARHTGRASSFGALVDQYCDHGREILVIAALAKAGALSPFPAVLYALAYPALNLTLFLCNYHRVPLPLALKSYLVVYPALFAYLWCGVNWLDGAVSPFHRPDGSGGRAGAVPSAAGDEVNICGLTKGCIRFIMIKNLVLLTLSLRGTLRRAQCKLRDEAISTAATEDGGLLRQARNDIMKGDLFMERSIGATDLRQQLTDVLQAVRERGETYIVETFGRPQAAIISLDEYRQIQRFRQEREMFFEWVGATAARNAERNVGLSDEEVLAIIEQARQEVASVAR